MASSGWQGQKNVQTSVYPHMALNLRVDSISHSGTTLTVKGIVRVVCTSGYIGYNNATVSLTGGGSKTLNLNLSTGGTADTGTFTCTINNVSATTTSKSVTATLSAGSVASGSASWTLTFNASTSAPTGLYINNISSTWDSVSGTIGLTSYGTGSGTKELTMLVLTQTYVAGLPHRWDKTTSGALSYNATVDNNSAAAAAGSIDIKGCGLYYTGVYVTNGSAVSRFAGPSVYTPPAPVVLNYVRIGETNQWQVTLTGDPNNNNTGYTAAQLNRSMRYKIDNGSWVNVETAAVKAIDATTIVTITVPAASTATIEGWMTYQGLNSEVGSITITNSDAPVHLYGSVNGQAKKLEHVYGSVNGRSVKLTKIYASVGGVAKLVHVDTGE
jgi:hypothetical protein